MLLIGADYDNMSGLYILHGSRIIAFHLLHSLFTVKSGGEILLQIAACPRNSKESWSFFLEHILLIFRN